jgi:hypothetical protein
MSVSKIRLGSMLGGTLLLGAFMGAFSVFLTTPNTRLKRVKPVEGLVGTKAEFLNHSFGVKIGSFAVYHTPGKDEKLAIVATQDSYPVILIEKADGEQVKVSISDKQQNMLGGTLRKEKFEITNYVNVDQEGMEVTNVDLDANGSYDLIAKQTRSGTEARFFFEGQWYPYKRENGKWLIETTDGWREIVKGSAGFHFP